MARPVYSERLLAAHAGASPSFVVPAGYRAVIRSIQGFNANAITPQPVQLILEDTSCTIYQRSLDPQTMDATEMRCVMLPGETLQAETGPDCDLTVSGYLLTLP